MKPYLVLRAHFTGAHYTGERAEGPVFASGYGHAWKFKSYAEIEAHLENVAKNNPQLYELLEYHKPLEVVSIYY